MTHPAETTLWVRIAPRPAALERTLRQLRTLLQAPLNVTLARGDDDAHELRVPHRKTGESANQIRRELLSLHDVLEVAVLPVRGSGPTREMALVRLEPGPGTDPDRPEALDRSNVRVIGAGGDHQVVEVTAAPDEIDDILSAWRARGWIRAVSRTGEIFLPDEASRRNPARS